MKKLYILASLLLGGLAFGQNLVTNPTFDNALTGWTAGTTATYTLPTLVASDGSDGANSAQYIPTATTGFYQEIAVTAGSVLKISFWYKATGDGTDARIWSNYKDAANAIIYQDANSANDPLRNNNTYLPTATAWTKYETTVTAPANVVTLVLAVRAYSGSTVNFDQFSVEVVPLAVSQNEITGLKIYSSNKMLYVTSDSSSDKNVVIYDLLGKMVVNQTVAEQAINVSNLATGAYIVKVTEDGKTATKKLVIE